MGVTISGLIVTNPTDLTQFPLHLMHLTLNSKTLLQMVRVCRSDRLRVYVRVALPLLIFVNWSLAQDPSLACIEELKSNQELQGLFKKMPVDVSKGQSLEVLANNTKPTANEKKLISIFIDALETCSNQGTGWREKNYPLSFNTLGAKHQSDFKIAASDLYGGKLTFGEFAKLRAKMMTELIANLQF